MKKYIGFLLLFIFWINNIFAASADIVGFKLSPLQNKTHVVFDLTLQPKYSIHILHQPERLVLDVENAKSKVNLNREFTDKIVKSVRSSEHDDGSSKVLRIVFDLQNSVDYKDSILKASWPNPNRLIIDLRPAGKTKQVVAVKKTSPKPVVVAAEPPKPVVVLPQNQKLHNIVVVIDPGHGGKDPGAIGLEGTREKDVVLAIAKDLQQMLNEQYGFTAKLTRDSDYFIPLRQRLSIATHDHADIFIAVHADAYIDHNAMGASVFALSERGATSEAARWLAQKENESELGQVLANKNDILRSVLIDLAQTASISTSLVIGNALIKQLAIIGNLHHDFVEQAAFVVLKEPDIPSLLVETGFISNIDEESRLRDADYQEEIAEALMRGIKDYFIQHPPPATFLAEVK